MPVDPAPPPGHDVIVIGGSAGAVEALSALVAGLPPDLPAAVCVVMHLRPYQESRLVRVLGRAAALPVVAAADGLPLRAGVVHVGVPDLHLLVERVGTHGVLRLVHGPRENRARPAVDPLFRSAALAFGPRVVGVVLSGALDDGTAGLWTVRDRGGLAVVQDPADAAVTGMPMSALAEVGAHHVAPARLLGPLLGRLAREPVPGRRDAGTGVVPPGHGAGAMAPSPGPVPPPPAPLAEPPTSAHDTPRPVRGAGADLEREMAILAMDESAHQRAERYGAPSRHVCPECGGVLWEVNHTEGGPLRFRCETGHAYTAATLAEEQAEHVEASLWAALRALEDQAELARRRAATARARGLATLATRFGVQEEAAQQHATALRAILRLDARPGAREAGDAANLPSAADGPDVDRRADADA